MPPLVKISDGALSPSSLLAENSGLLFEILPPQRQFKWKKQQIDQMWDDIIAAHREQRESYFLGTLLLEPLSDPRVSVLDGQQRITSLSLLLAVLRDQCKSQGLDPRAGSIQRLISRVDNDGNPVGSLVVKLQDPDNQTYIDLVGDYGSTSIASSRSGLLAKAVQTLTNHVKAHINVPDPQACLRALCDYIQDRVKLLPLAVRSEGEGYLVFDTTNTRGLRLSPSEAMKARLATIARQDHHLSEDLMQKWKVTATKLESASLSIDAMDDYLHAILCWRDGYTTKRTMDKIASNLVRTDALKDFVKDFVKDLESYCSSYLAVVAPSAQSSLAEDLKDLRSLNIQSQSFLTMVHKHSHSKFEKAVGLVLSLQIRNITMGPHQANKYEKDWPKWAALARQGKSDHAFDEIRGHMISDEDFQQQFAEESVVSPKTVRHLLRRLDPISRPGSGVFPMEVDVEHILPKSVVRKLTTGKPLTTNVRRWIEHLGYPIPGTPEEMQELGKILQPYLNRLGNQALLNDRANRGARDRPFDKKRAFYERQALELTKALKGRAKWTMTEIKTRQKRLAKDAPQVWPK